jgi:2-polyprenyl-3-methyl-5-hydroxy-6-metoxy-1,4-benzoquinol methylase
MAKTDRFYDTALSFIHDNYFGQLALDASQMIKNLLIDNEPSDYYIVDLGCGSGILARELSKKGFKVLGVDISEQMLNIAKRKAPKASFIHSSLFDFSIRCAMWFVLLVNQSIICLTLQAIITQ